jgi:hypothetical protein
MFNIKNVQTIRNQILSSKKDSHKDGRPSLITPDIGEFIIEVVTQRFKESDPISIHEMLDLILEDFGVGISLDTFRHYIRRNDFLHIIAGDPMEAPRVQINYKEILDWYDKLGETIKSVPRNFIFNMDESGIDEYVDQTNLSVLVPKTFQEKSIPIPVHRKVKRATLTACISASGDTLKPFIIIPRGTIDEELYYAGYTSDKVVFHHHMHSFMTKKTFELWMNSIFFPALQEKRKFHRYQGNAVLILDGFSGHNYDKIEEQCTKNNLTLTFLIPHTSHLCQPLDLLTFASLKKNFNEIKFDKCQTAQSNKIVRLMRAWQKSISPDAIISTFQAAGIVSSRSTEHYTYFCTINLSISLHLSSINRSLVEEEFEERRAAQAREGEHEDQHVSNQKQASHRPDLDTPKTSPNRDRPTRIPVSSASVESPAPPKKMQKYSQNDQKLSPTIQSGPKQLTLHQTMVRELSKRKDVQEDEIPK